ncbi:MAG: hypothetical protein AAGJ35_16005, partial [Myxococcota bacterium]
MSHHCRCLLHRRRLHSNIVMVTCHKCVMFVHHLATIFSQQFKLEQRTGRSSTSELGGRTLLLSDVLES